MRVGAADLWPAIDGHVYILDPARFAFQQDRGYRPKPGEVGTAEDCLRLMDRERIACAVAIQSSPYGYDWRAVVDAAERSAGRVKAVGVFPADVARSQLTDLAGRGVVGARFNLVDFDPAALARPEAGVLLELLEDLGLFAEIFASSAQWAQILPIVKRSGVRVVVDHFAGFVDADGASLPSPAHLAALAELKDPYVKLTAANRLSSQDRVYSDLDATVAGIVRAFGLERMLWGSGWPFINTSKAVDYPVLTDNLARWFPDAADRLRIVWETPARVFGFPAPASSAAG